MGGRNSGQLRLNFGMAILIDNDYLRAIFEWKTPKKHVAKTSPFGLKIKNDINSLLIIFNLFLGGIMLSGSLMVQL